MGCTIQLMETMRAKCWLESLFGRHHSQEDNIWESNIKPDLKETGWMDWNNVAQDRGRWRAVVNTVTTLRVLQRAWLAPPLEDLYSTELENKYVFRKH